jgi:hypothetical protein
MKSSKNKMANLLATENITVEYRNQTTASCDLESRTLYLPKFKEDLSDNVLDLFLGHEVSHFLHTPTDAWLEVIKHTRKSIVNIVEDVRIEKKIQLKYPGIRSSFINGYNELYFLDFFGVKDDNLNELRFLDRINLHFKVGAKLCIEFSEDESYYINKINSLVSFDDVIKISKELEEYCKTLNEENRKSEFEDLEFEDLEFEDSDSGDFEDLDSGDSGMFDWDLNLDELDASTQRMFDASIESLLSTNYQENEYVNIHIPNSKDFIIPPQTILKDFYKEIYGNFEVPPQTIFGNYNSFLKENLNVVQYLVNEFNLKKNADQYKNTKISKTGILNEKMLYAHKISEDLFRTSTNIKSGKSHGIVLFLDWSGSMQNTLSDTIKQLLNMVLFCKKLSIPYEVYAFTTHYGKEQRQQKLYPDGVNVDIRGCQLLNFFSSKMSNLEFKQITNILLGINSGSYIRGGTFTDIHYDVSLPSVYILGYTPLNDAIMLAMDIVPKFKEFNKVQFVHSIFLTDGDSDLSRMYYRNSGNIYSNNRGLHGQTFTKKNLILREQNSKINEPVAYTSESNQVTQTLFRMLRRYLDDNVIGFRIITKADVKKNRINYYFKSSDVYDTGMQHLKKHNYVSVENKMFNKCFLIKDTALDISDKDYNVKENASAKAIAKSFSKFIINKRINRIFLKEFISLIA